MLGLYGKKMGMTQVFGENGRQVPVTVLSVPPSTLVATRTKDREGYDALVLGTEDCKEKHLNKALLGQFKKAKVSPKRRLYEIESPSQEPLNVGSDLGLALFEGVDKVTVIGKSKGKGFAGTIKRYGFSRGPMTHGSHNKRPPGSIGACAYPSRVFPGQRLPGHYGDARVSVKNLRVVKVDSEKGLMYVRGAVPGPKNASVFIRKS